VRALHGLGHETEDLKAAHLIGQADIEKPVVHPGLGSEQEAAGVAPAIGYGDEQRRLSMHPLAVINGQGGNLIVEEQGLEQSPEVHGEATQPLDPGAFNGHLRVEADPHPIAEIAVRDTIHVYEAHVNHPGLARCQMLYGGLYIQWNAHPVGEVIP